MLSDVVEKWGGFVEFPMDLYTNVFRLGEGYIEHCYEKGGKFKANPLIIGYANGRTHRKIMFEDTFEETLREFQEMDWAYMSGCTYFGKRNTAERQSKLYAFIVDLDGVTDSKLNNFFYGAFNDEFDIYPIPQHVVLSGHGVHLYYVLKEPIDLYPDIKTKIKEFKYALIRSIWNPYTSTIKTPQYQGINQSFRVPGSKTKDGCDLKICTAYRLNTNPTCMEELNRYVPEQSRVDIETRTHLFKLTLAEAKAAYPEWYKRVILGGVSPCQWVVKEDLYKWWLRKISSDDVKYGHRYFCIMCLAIYAAKCGIYDRKRVRHDARSLIPHFNNVNPEHPFTEADIDSALECLDSRFATFPKKDIEKLTDIVMPVNRRNGRKQDLHLVIARSIRDTQRKAMNQGPWWENGNKDGAPTKQELIQTYAKEHPEANHSQIARALGVSRPTVIKWLKK